MSTKRGRVQGYETYEKDTQNSVVVNINTADYDKYIAQKNRYKYMNERNTRKIQELSNEIDNLKDLIRGLYDK